MKIPKLNGIKLLPSPLKQSNVSTGNFFDCEHIFYSTSHFYHMLRIEKKRSERSHKPFLLVLFDISGLDTEIKNGCTREKLKNIILACSRETDIRGWIKYNKIIGIIYTEITSIDGSSIETIFRKVNDKIGNILGAEFMNKIRISIEPIAPSHELPPVEQFLPNKTKETETRKESETLSQSFIYNEIIAY
jgi:hypothetical protein